VSRSNNNHIFLALIISYLRLQIHSMDSWNETFFDKDAPAYESSDSSNDSDFNPFSIDPGTSEEEIDVGPAIEVVNTQLLHERMDGQMVDKVCEVLHVMAQLGINLVLFLDAVSWGNPACIADLKIRSAQTGLMKSQELPSILRRWWKPPRPPGSSNARSAGATDVMMSFARECYLTVVDKKLEKMVPLFKSPLGDDVTEDHLTGVVFTDLIEEVKKRGPFLWSILHRPTSAKYSQETR
jgi:hypothetical protein